MDIDLDFFVTLFHLHQSSTEHWLVRGPGIYGVERSEMDAMNGFVL